MKQLIKITSAALGIAGMGVALVYATRDAKPTVPETLGLESSPELPSASSDAPRSKRPPVARLAAQVAPQLPPPSTEAIQILKGVSLESQDSLLTAVDELREKPADEVASLLTQAYESPSEFRRDVTVEIASRIDQPELLPLWKKMLRGGEGQAKAELAILSQDEPSVDGYRIQFEVGTALNAMSQLMGRSAESSEELSAVAGGEDQYRDYPLHLRADAFDLILARDKRQAVQIIQKLTEDDPIRPLLATRYFEPKP